VLSPAADQQHRVSQGDQRLAGAIHPLVGGEVIGNTNDGREQCFHDPWLSAKRNASSKLQLKVR
jgi:hypothetical protein